MRHPFDNARSLLKAWKPTGLASKSPKATGVPADFQLGTTSSGKVIHSDYTHPDHASFDMKDHSDAHLAHQKHLEELKVSSPNPSKGLLDHHEAAKQFHRDQFKRLKSSG